MNAETATDEVIDSIAHIEMHRQEMAKEAGLATACTEALRKLHGLLDEEREALQQPVPGTAHSANIEAVTTEIEKVKKLARVTSQGAISRNPRPGQNQTSSQNGPRNPNRNKGRRTMGRRGER